MVGASACTALLALASFSSASSLQDSVRHFSDKNPCSYSVEFGDSQFAREKLCILQ